MDTQLRSLLKILQFTYAMSDTSGFHRIVYSAGGMAFSNAYFGAGTGPIVLDEVQCTSSASQLLECSSNPIATHNCLHSADAGVGCEGEYHGYTFPGVLECVFICFILI